MTDIMILRAEAKELLDEVNYCGERSPNGKLISTSYHSFQNSYGQNTFKKRLAELKRRMKALPSQAFAMNKL